MISAALIAQLTLFEVSVQAAAPIEQASSLTKAALVKAGQQLVSAIDQAISAAAGALNMDDPTGFAGDLIGSLLSLSGNADDQTTLVDLRGRVGRAVFNLAQA